MLTSLYAPDAYNNKSINTICIGSGRFLRSVLVPALVGAGFQTAIFQTRGRTFLEYCQKHNPNATDQLTFEVDTVQHDGSITTQNVPFHGAGTLGTTQGKEQNITLLSSGMKSISVIGVGVTEAGLASVSTKAVNDLFDILFKCYTLMKTNQLVCENPNGKICIINTDNVPGNGSLLKRYMLEIGKSRYEEDSEVCEFLKEKVSFHDTMVDRITSQRDGSDGMVPRAEPVPTKALVIEDLEGDLPVALCSSQIQKEYGVVVRSKAGQLDGDIALKLRVANGTHTAVAHVMALCQLLLTDALSSSSSNFLLMKYLDAYFHDQILPAAKDVYGQEETEAVYDDWRKRLIHEHFGLSTFFITQNGAAKGGIRFGPTIHGLISNGKAVTCSTAFALAAILRFLTPAKPLLKTPENGIYRGWLDESSRTKVATANKDSKGDTVGYADGLSYNLKDGWYEFRCNCEVNLSQHSTDTTLLPDALGSFGSTRQAAEYEDIVRAYLVKSDGGNLSDLEKNISTKKSMDILVKSVATLYARMVAGDGMLNILQEMVDGKGIFEECGLSTRCKALMDGNGEYHDKKPLHYRLNPIPKTSKLMNGVLGSNEDVIRSLIFSEVSSAPVIDLHTHLLPPTHGILCLWGIDELLTYHYLVAEYFMTAPPSVSPQGFYDQSKQKQADMIWQALFIDRSPISEACRGVITTLKALGLDDALQARDLNLIRNFFSSFRSKGVEGSERYCEKVFQLSGVRYAVMTNIPFNQSEAQHWRPKPKPYSENFRSALRVDPLLAGDRKTIEETLALAGYDKTIEGACQYLRDWCDTMKPEYMMASTPHNFVLPEEGGTLSGVNKVGVNEDAMTDPFAFVDATNKDAFCNQECTDEDNIGSIIDENSDFLSEVLMKICEERDLPVALKIGAHRKVNPSLMDAGDGIVAFADASVLSRLCSRFPKVRFLVTFLSRNNQHEACVLASKFRNLHIYGCWWFCNNPSLIREITTMRVEMLGTAFTAQHSDARVIDQLIYKWSHSRAVIAEVLVKEYSKALESGWAPTRGEIRRDVERLFGTSYEEFMAKSLV